MKDNFIKSYSFDFSTEIALYCKILEDKRYYNVANQLFRSGTSIGANVWEADHAESRKDFVHKMKISSKEASETEYWLKLCSVLPDYPDVKHLSEMLVNIRNVLDRIITTSNQSK